MYPLHRPRLVGVKAQYCALSWSTERNPMTIQVWCSIEVFHQSDARTIPAMVNTGGITRDILRALHVRMALHSEGRVAINEVCLPTADMVRLDRQTPVDCMHHTILVVDDDRPIRNRLCARIRRNGQLAET